MNRMVWHGNKVLRRIEKQSPKIVNCIARTIAKYAKVLVPVKTGRLRREIKAIGSRVEANTPYAGIVELGAAKRAAQPYLRPSVEQFSKSDLDKCIK